MSPSPHFGPISFTFMFLGNNWPNDSFSSHLWCCHPLWEILDPPLHSVLHMLNPGTCRNGESLYIYMCGVVECYTGQLFFCKPSVDSIPFCSHHRIKLTWYYLPYLPCHLPSFEFSLNYTKLAMLAFLYCFVMKSKIISAKYLPPVGIET